MGRDVENPGIIPKDGLGSVPVMDVPVDDQDPLTFCCKRCRTHGNIVQQAESHCAVCFSVMSRWSHGDEGDTFTLQLQGPDRLEAGTGGSTGRREGVRLGHTYRDRCLRHPAGKSSRVRRGIWSCAPAPRLRDPLQASRRTGCRRRGEGHALHPSPRRSSQAAQGGMCPRHAHSHPMGRRLSAFARSFDGSGSTGRRLICRLSSRAARASRYDSVISIPKRNQTVPYSIVARHIEPGMMEHVQHGLVLTEGLGDECSDTSVPGGPCQLVEQQRPEAVVLVIIRHDEGHFGLRDADDSVEPTHGDQLSVHSRPRRPNDPHSPRW